MLNLCIIVLVTIIILLSYRVISRLKFNPLDFIRDEISKLPDVQDRGIMKHGAVKRGFLGRIGYALKLMFVEKEIIVFSLLQVAAIAFGYYLWVQMLDWIPDEVWKSAAESDDGSIADVVLLAWSFVCVGVVAFPLGLLSACMGAAHFLHRSGKSSTIAACLRIVLSRAWSLWVFHWIDGWITVNQILNRMPRKRDKRSPAEKALSETLYYAWKLGTMGVLPSLITGRNLVDSGKNAVLVVRAKLVDLSRLRLGYSAICWIVGVGAYVCAVPLVMIFDPMPNLPVYKKVYELYLIVGIPAVLAAAIVQLFLRPIYVISLCDIYSDYLKEKGEEVVLPAAPNRAISAVVAFGLLCVLIGAVFLYRHELGIMNMLSTPYGKPYRSP